MINPANRESSGAQDPGRRAFLINTGLALGAAAVAETLSPFVVLADSRRQAAVKLSEISINILKSESGAVLGEQTGVREGNDYILSPTQERGRERAQKVSARILADGTSRERIQVMRRDGTIEYRNDGDTYVFEGFKDALAPVRDNCGPNPCNEELWDGINIDVYRVRKGGVLEYFLTFPTAFDCNPRMQKVTDKITTIQEQPKPPAPVVTPPPATPTPPRPPVQAPAQVPRKSYEPSLKEEFGSVAIIDAGQLERVVYE